MKSQARSRSFSNLDLKIEAPREFEAEDDTLKLLLRLLEYEMDSSRFSRTAVKHTEGNLSEASPPTSIFNVDFDPIRLSHAHNGAPKPPPRRFYLYWWRGIAAVLHKAEREANKARFVADIQARKG